MALSISSMFLAFIAIIAVLVLLLSVVAMSQGFKDAGVCGSVVSFAFILLVLSAVAFFFTPITGGKTMKELIFSGEEKKVI